MPLLDYVPAIDNRTYDDIVAEARTRIARYTPEWAPLWTDVNDSDPGITLVQVFAWLAEMLIYRMNQVPELNYLKFLELLGIELRPAEPAAAEITFPVAAGVTAPYIIVPQRTQVSAPGPNGGPPVVFETDRSLFALTTPLAAVLAYDGYSFEPLTNANNDAQVGFQPFGAQPATGAALLLGFAPSGITPFPQVEVNIAVWVLQQAATLSAYDCSLPQTQVYPSAGLVWQYWNGVGWYALSLLKDETLSLQRSGHVYLKTPPAGQMQLGTFDSLSDPLYWMRAVIQSGGYERPPVLSAIRTNTVSASQAQTVQDEVLGGSTGAPNQTFNLANTPVLDGTMLLQVDEGDGFKDWTPVADFFGASPDDLVYVLDRTTGGILFGDGQHGHIPVANVGNPSANVVARTYRYGGGTEGNVAARTLTTTLTSISGIDDSKVGNLFAASGGRDEESLQDAKLRAPLTLKNKCRAVTAEDFESLAKEAANVKRAFAIPLFHPGFPGVKVPGVVTVIVVPDADVPNPTPSDGTIRTVCAYLNQRRLLTTELYVIPPTYQRVEIQVQVTAKNSADLAEVQQAVERALLTYFHPLTGGDDGLGWPFGGTIYFSRAYHEVLNVAGVQRVEQLVIVLDGQPYPVCQDVPVKPAALVYSMQHEIQVDYSFDQ
jgi:predicted phage baseplate assembly protein